MEKKVFSFVLSDVIVALLVAYTKALASKWTQLWPEKVEAQENCVGGGLLRSWPYGWAKEQAESFCLHFTNLVVELVVGAETKKEEVFVSPDGRLWALVHGGQGQNATGFYAQVGVMPGAGPLVPLEHIKAIAGVESDPCDCGGGGGKLVEIWGDPEEQRATREALISALR